MSSLAERIFRRFFPFEVFTSVHTPGKPTRARTLRSRMDSGELIIDNGLFCLREIEASLSMGGSSFVEMDTLFIARWRMDQGMKPSGRLRRRA